MFCIFEDIFTSPSFRPLRQELNSEFTRTMSDSSDENLSDLEEEQDVKDSGSEGDDEEKVELKGILNDVEETDVSWKDLVSVFRLVESTCI